MSKKIKAPIQEICQVVHDSKNRGIDIKTTLQKYGITKRIFYYKCKMAGIDTWTTKNRDMIIVKKPIKALQHQNPTQKKQWQSFKIKK